MEMLNTKTPSEILSEYLAQENPPAAVLFEDSNYSTFEDANEGRSCFNQSGAREAYLMVYKPKYGSYLREKAKF